MWIFFIDLLSNSCHVLCVIQSTPVHVFSRFGTVLFHSPRQTAVAHCPTVVFPVPSFASTFLFPMHLHFVAVPVVSLQLIAINNRMLP